MHKKNLRLKNIQALDDDYIKFIRFAQWKIDQNGEGIVGLISNNRYLEGDTYKQMRKSLLDSFDRIYILNLHGSARETREISQTTNDENVFDEIQQGVSIGIFIKNNRITEKKVHYAELCAARKEKYSWLSENTIATARWRDIQPEEPYYFFVPKDFTLKNEYLKFTSVDEIFELKGMGVTSHRDNLVVDFSEIELSKKLDLFQSEENDETLMRLLKIKDTKDWQIKKARSEFKKLDYRNYIKQLAYRPFDTRVICYSSILIDRPRERIMAHLLDDYPGRERNFALILPKTMLSSEFSIFAADQIADAHLLTVKDDNFHVFPLYLRTSAGKERKIGDSNSHTAEDVGVPNFKKAFVEFLQRRYPGCLVTPEQVAGYIYAILHSPTYRETYDVFLKIDFPRINFVEDYSSFKSLAELGMRLINLHLMNLKLETKTTFDVRGSNIVAFVTYKEGKVHINKTQFFDGVPEDAWTFYLGSFQVLDKWLKSRKGRELSSSDIEQFLQIVEVVKKTVEYVKEIDGLAQLS